MLTRVNDVARLLGEPDHVIRYWSDEFKVRPLRSKGDHRHFEPSHVATMAEIQRLLRTEGLTMAAAKRRLKGK